MLLLATVAVAFSGPAGPAALSSRHTPRSAGAQMLYAVRAEAQLHAVARRAMLQGENDEAKECYKIARAYGSSRSYLLAALLHARLGEFEAARSMFAEGVLVNREDAKLVQAWGLFESKQACGPACSCLRRALRLVQRAVALDPSLSGVLSWRIFVDAAEYEQQRRQRSAARRCASPAMAMAVDSARSICVPLPTVVYTVPSHQTLGWRGRADVEGEEPGVWYDADGPRNGPPPNYWRQSSDERGHRAAFSAVELLLSSGGADESALLEAEAAMTVKQPGLNRKLLGRWATIVRGGELVARRADAADAAAGAAAGGGITPVGAVHVPSVLTVRRPGGRRTNEHRYGLFDAHLEEGEPIELQLSLPADADGADGVSAAASGEVQGRGELLASASNERRRASPLVVLGGVSLLSDYLLVMRTEDGKLAEVYTRLRDRE